MLSTILNCLERTVDGTELLQTVYEDHSDHMHKLTHIELSHTVCEQLELRCDKNNVNREKENNETYLPVQWEIICHHRSDASKKRAEFTPTGTPSLTENGKFSGVGTGKMGGSLVPRFLVDEAEGEICIT